MQDANISNIVQTQAPVTVGSPPNKHDIRDFTSSDEDFKKTWQMWQIIFPKWPIERQRLEKILHKLPGQHYIHEKGFCLSFLSDGPNGKIAAVGVMPEYRGKGLGTALLKHAQAGLRNTARTRGDGELKSMEIGSFTPRFWPQVPTNLPQEVKDFFVHRGIQHPRRLPDQKR
jgi:beta-N-acetylhexosaminidase